MYVWPHIPETSARAGLPVFFARQVNGMERSNDAEPAPDFSALIKAVGASGDRAAFRQLYVHFAPRLKGYLSRLGCAPPLADELTQECMLSVWRKAHSFDPVRAGAATWIFTIVRNLRIDYARKIRAGTGFQPDASDAPEAPAGPDQLMLLDERERRVREALHKLSPEQGEVIRLFYFGEKPHSEISKTLNLPLGTVKSRVRLALARLQNLLGDFQ